MKKIPLFKPFVSERSIERVAEVLRSGWVGEGPVVKEFEARFGERVGNPLCVAVNSGTSALHLALILAGVGPGDEVVTTAQTMLATSQAILAVDAVPVYGDVEYGTGNLDASTIEERITPKTRAIVGVDWGGAP